MDYEAMWDELKELLLNNKKGVTADKVSHNLDVVIKMVAISDKYSKCRYPNKTFTASDMGKKGGASTSDAKAKASAKNGKLGGRPKRVIIGIDLASGPDMTGRSKMVKGEGK